MSEKPFTADDIEACWGNFVASNFADILNGEYSLDNARRDLRSLIGSKHDPRQIFFDRPAAVVTGESSLP